MINENHFKIENDCLENDGKFEEIYDICFGPGRFAKAAHLLRENNQCLYDISKIIIDCDNGNIIGGCRIWPISFSGGGKAIFLGPIAILPQYRNFGFGGKLVAECLSANANKNNLPIFLIGDLGFFSKFGFKNIPTNNIILPSPAIQNRILYYGENIDFNVLFCGKISAI